MDMQNAVHVSPVLYARVEDFLRKQGSTRDPALAMGQVITHWIENAGAQQNPPSQRAEASTWSNDWIMFESPPGPRSTGNSVRPPQRLVQQASARAVAA